MTVSTTALAWTVPERVVELSEHPPIVMVHQDGSTQTVETSPALSVLAPRVEGLKVLQAPSTEALPSVGLQPKPFSFQKRPTALSLAEENKVDYTRAMYHYAKGHHAKATPLFQRVLGEQADHHAARVALATLYLQDNNLDCAQNLLVEGLLLDEYHADFLRLMAFVHDQRQEPEKALVFLEKVRPHQRQDPQYVSFLGYIYHKTGHYDLARQQYGQLLAREPENPAWILGLSMALEGEGERASALEGYSRLHKTLGIDPRIVKYARERMHELKG